MAATENVRCTDLSQKDFKALPHQRDVADYFVNKSRHKGILLYHKLGAGKTSSSILIADMLLEQKKVKKVIVLSPGALRANFISEYCSISGKFPENFHDNFFFYSYNYTGILGRLPSDLNDSLIIIDEAHNLINGKRNEGDVKAKVYDIVRDKSTNSKIVLLSGTPVVGGQFDLYLLTQLIKPGAFYKSNGNAERFKMLISDSDYTMKELEGIVSYFAGTTDQRYFPTLLPQKYVETPLSTTQLDPYIEFRAIESKAMSDLKKVDKNSVSYKMLKSSSYLNTVMLKSRRVSNFVYPPEIQEQILKLSDFEGTIDEERKEVKQMLADTSWINDDLLTRLKTENSPKFRELMLNVLQNEGKHLIYSGFKEFYGTKLISSLLNNCETKTLTFTGDMDDKKRNEALNLFNAESNKNGEEYKAMIITSAGAEGITLKSCRYVHIIEPNGNESFIDQIIGRAVRFKSHDQLPPDERTVTVFRYISVLSRRIHQDVTIRKKDKETVVEVSENLTSDQLMLARGRDKKNKILTVLSLMQNASIEKYVETKKVEKKRGLW